MAGSSGRPGAPHGPAGVERPGRVLALVCILLAAGSCADFGGRLLATLDGDTIREGDLELYEFVNSLDGREGVATLDADRERLRRLRSLQDLMAQRLLLRRAEVQGTLVSDEEVDVAMEGYSLPYGTQQAFHAFLDEAGQQIDDLRGEIRRRLTVIKLLNRDVRAKVRVTGDEMRAYYERHEATFSVPEQQLRLAQILVTAAVEAPVPNLRNDDATSLEAARRKIQRIHERLESGDDFEQLALDYSEDQTYASTGGDMGFIPESALVKADRRLRRAVVALLPGEVSRVIEGDGEFRIVRLIAVEPAGRREFGDPGVQDAIREVLANRREQLLRAVLLETERNRAAIRNYLAEDLASEFGIGR